MKGKESLFQIIHYNIKLQQLQHDGSNTEVDVWVSETEQQSKNKPMYLWVFNL